MQIVFNRNTLLLTLLIAVCLAVTAYVLWTVAPPKFFSDSKHEGISIVRDDHELSVFFDRIAYYYHGAIPYRYARIEYPPLAVLYLSIPAIFTSNFAMYEQLLVIQNLLMGLALVFVTYQLLTTLNHPRRFLWLFALPSMLYFTVNRFDILPALLVQTALLVLFRKKYALAFFILSLAFLSKGYALVLFPVFFLFYMIGKPSLSLLKNTSLVWFVAPIAAVTIVVCAVAGLANGLFPYYFQSTRDFAYGAFFVTYLLALQPALPAWLWRGLTTGAAKVLTVLQVTLPALLYTGYQVFRKLVRGRRQAISWLLVVLLLYVGFSVYYSPQWIVWLVPLFIVLAPSRREVFLIVAYDFLSYLQFPVMLNYLGYQSTAFSIIVLVRTVVLVLLVIVAARRAWARPPDALVTPVAISST